MLNTSSPEGWKQKHLSNEVLCSFVFYFIFEIYSDIVLHFNPLRILRILQIKNALYIYFLHKQIYKIIIIFTQ